MNITLRQLHSFRAIADLGSFTRAADRLRMAQPALSLTIRELEAELKVRLFDRTTRRVNLTAAGDEFLLAVDKLISDLEVAIQNLQDISDRKRGRLVIAAPPLLAAMIAPTAIADYKRAFPGIEVRLIDTQTNLVVEKIRSGEADCGIGTFAKDEDNIRREVLFKDELMAWCTGRHAQIKPKSISWLDLGQYPLIALTKDSGIRLLVDTTRNLVGLSQKPAYEVAQMTTAIMLVEAGLGIAVLPAYVWGFAKAFDVVSRTLSDPRVNREVALIHDSSRSLSPAAEIFARFLRKRSRATFTPALRKG